MRLSHGFYGASAWIAPAMAAVFWIGCCGCADKRPERTLLWRTAWQKAERVSSPIDGGRTRIALATQAAQAHGSDELENLIRSDPEPWVKGAGLALATVSAALDGDRDLAEQRMRDAQRCETQTDEWRLPFLNAELEKGKAALVLTSKSDRHPDVASLAQWTANAPAERTHAAAWVCAEWLHRKGAAEQTAQTRAVLHAALTYSERLYPWDRLATLARVASAARACGQDNAVRTALDRLFDPNRHDALSASHFETAVAAARTWAGLGDRGRASRSLNLAETRLRQRKTGDAAAPWALFAEAQAEAGVPVERVKQTWRTALNQPGGRSGFYQNIDAALTLGGIAASTCKWTKEDVAEICHETEGIAVARQ